MLILQGLRAFTPTDPGDLEKFVRSSQSNKKLLDKDSAFWIDLIRKDLNIDLVQTNHEIIDKNSKLFSNIRTNFRSQFIKSPKIVLKGKPSKAKAEELSLREEIRLEEQIANLGTEGLKEKERILEAAIESQQLPGEDVLGKIPLGNVSTIEFR